jgi:hypothetical protein
VLGLIALSGAPCIADPVTPLTETEKSTTHAISLNDRVLFPPELFPGFERQTPDELLLAGLAAKYPGRIVRTPPALPAAPPVVRASVLVRLPNGIDYVRCYANGIADVSVPEFAPGATGRVIDLRFFSTAPDSVSACVRLCEKLTGAVPRVQQLGEYFSAEKPSVQGKGAEVESAPLFPVIVLVNYGTSGPVEAMLADLQVRRKIILVGTATAGNTARYIPVDKVPGWWRICGELQSDSASRSLVGTGVAPRVRVAVSQDADLLAWQWVERGAGPDTVLRLSQQQSAAGTRKPESPAPGANGNDAAAPVDAPAGTDLLFRRGYDILVALQVMADAPVSR